MLIELVIALAEGAEAGFSGFGAVEAVLVLKYLAAWSTDTQTGVKRANCPNCGAPVPIVGSKVCQYCGSALKVWAGTGWLLTDLRED